MEAAHCAAVPGVEPLAANQPSPPVRESARLLEPVQENDNESPSTPQYGSASVRASSRELLAKRPELGKSSI